MACWPCSCSPTRARRRVWSTGSSSRSPSRTGAAWDRASIAEGVAVLERALRLPRAGSYAIQAAIAAVHAEAPAFADTDWAQIAGLYEQLLRHDPSPVVALNRAVAVGFAEGAEAGLGAAARRSAPRALRALLRGPLRAPAPHGRRGRGRRRARHRDRPHDQRGRARRAPQPKDSLNRLAVYLRLSVPARCSRRGGSATPARSARPSARARRRPPSRGRSRRRTTRSRPRRRRPRP